MKLAQLVSYLTDKSRLLELYKSEGLNVDSEALLIYMKQAIDLQSDVVIFSLEETDDEQIFIRSGVQFIQLFPIDYAIELIDADLQLIGKGHSDAAIAARLIEYRKHDA